MQPRNQSGRTTHPFRGFAAALGLGLLAFAAADPAHADTPREITNIAEVSHAIGNGERITVTAQATIEIARMPVEGSLRILQLECPLDCGPSETRMFDGGAYSTSATADGRFMPLAAPYNHSDVHGLQGPVDISRPISVIEAPIIPLGAPLFVVLESDDLNMDPARAETALVTLHDRLTGDKELLRLRETGPDTGVFTAAIEATDPPPSHGDGTISTEGMSTVTAHYTDPLYPSNTMEAAIDVGPIDPHGIVYDEMTGASVDGVKVTLLDDATGQPAEVLGDDLRSAYPATIRSGSTVTDAAGNSYEMEPGGYRFPFVRPGRYRFEIETPEGYVPSQLKPGGATRFANAAPAGDPSAHGFDDPFVIGPGQPLQIDIALARASIVSVVRTADTDTAGPGDFVEFHVEITASTDGVLSIVDTLPGELRKVPGTLAIDGVSTTPQVSRDGRRLRINDHAITAAAPLEMTYTAQVNVSARPGSSLRSRSDVNSTVPTASDTHDLRVTDSFDMDSIAILGDVVAGPCGAPQEERDLSGIRIYTETGEFAVTDSDGRFTFRDMTRRPTVLQLDELTLPPGARPVLCRDNTRRAGSAISQFVDLRPGLMGQASFHIEFDAQAEMAASEQPHPESAWAEATRPDPVAIYTPEWLYARPADAGPQVLFPPQGHQAHSSAINLFYLRPADARAEVLVNGQTADPRRRDPATQNLLGTLALERWRGLRLDEGRNTITVILTARDGDEIFRQTREVLLGGAPANAELIEDTSVLRTDGRTNPVIEMRLTDRDGIPVRPGTRVSVRTEAPFAFAPEGARRGAPASERSPSTTIQAEVGANGVIRLVMAPTLETATATLTIPGARRDITREVRISAADRPWVLVGIAEGTLAADHVRRHMRADDGAGAPPPGRIAFFAEGVIRGEWLLTLRYDSDRDGSGDFHGIDPDKDYIVYGDRSYQGNAAQSRFPLYLRLRREGAEFLVGDFDSAIDTGLISHNRRMTGARASWETDSFRVMAFAARTDERHVTDRFASDGTIGPYPLTGSDIVQHSETVRVVTVSRRDATEELASETLVPGVDYVLDRRRGELRLYRAVPAFTPDLHRNLIVVEYETDDAAQSGRVLGLRAEADVTDRATLGATMIDARKVEGQDVDARLMGVDLTYEVNDALTFSAEILQMRKAHPSRVTTGRQGELRFGYDDGINRAEMYLRHQRGNVTLNADDTNADLTSAGLQFSTRIAGPNVRKPAERGLFVEGAASYTHDRLAQTRRGDAEVMVINRQERLSFGAGLRVVGESGATGRSHALKALAQVGWTTADDRLSVELGSERTIHASGTDPAPDVSSLSARYQVTDGLTAIGSLRTTLDRRGATVASVGIEASPWGGAEMRGGVAMARNGARAGQSVHLGIDQTFEPREGLSLSLGMDAQHDLGAADVPLGSALDNPFSSESFITARAGARRTAETWSAGIDTEARISESDRTVNLRVSADGEFGDNWTVGGAGFIGRTRPTSGDSRHDVDIRLSAAHRGGADAPVTLLQGELRNSREGDIERVTGYGSVYHARQITEADSLNLRYAMKYVDTRNSSGRHRDLLNFVGGEYRRDITAKFDIGVHGSVMHSRAQGSAATSFGLSAGFTPFENGWMSLGYNFNGFHDAEFSENGHTDQGPFVQFRMKFDQNSIRRLFR